MIKRTCEKQKRRKRVAQLNIIINLLDMSMYTYITIHIT